MKVLLARPPDRRLQHLHLWPELGLGYLSKCLAPHHDVTVIDAPARRMSVQGFGDAAEKIRPDVVGLRLQTFAIPDARRCVREVRDRLPRTPVLLGGPHVTADPEVIFDDFPEADFAFHGEADVGLPMLLSALAEPHHDLSEIPGLIWKDQGTVRVNAPWYAATLDSLGMPDWPSLDPLAYTSYRAPAGCPNLPAAPIMITRGCRHACAFCGSVGSKTFRSRSPENVLEEVLFLKGRYGVGHIVVADASLTDAGEELARLCEGLINAHRPVFWTIPNGVRVDTLTSDLVRLMWDAGCRGFPLGIESGSDRVLGQMRKGITTAMVRETVAMIRSVSRIEVTGFFVIGFPGETPSEALETARFARTLPIAGANFFLYGDAPGSPIYMEKKAQGTFRSDPGRRRIWGIGTVPRAGERGFSRCLWKVLYLWAWISFSLRPRILLRILKRTPPRELLAYLRAIFLDR